MAVPAVIRASYIIDCPGHGARETWFFTQTSNDLTQAINTWAATTESRRLLLGAEAQLKALELSIETDTNGTPVLGDSVIQYVYLQGFQSEPLADPQLALLFKNQTADRTKRRNSYLRCIWDSIEVNGGKYIVPQGSTWQTKLNNWKAKMLAIPIGYLQGTRGPRVGLTGYTTPADGHSVLTFASGIFTSLPVGTKTSIRISTARQPSQLTGKQVVQVLSSTTCQLVNATALLPFTGVGWTGSLYAYQFIVTPFMDDQKVVERHIGRPLLESPGRRKGRARV